MPSNWNKQTSEIDGNVKLSVVAAPQITAYVEETFTSTDRVDIEYGEEDPDAGVFDYYAFTIHTDPPNTIKKLPTDKDRRVTFDTNLEAGARYTVSAYTVSGREESDSYNISVTTSK